MARLCASSDPARTGRADEGSNAAREAQRDEDRGGLWPLVSSGRQWSPSRHGARFGAAVPVQTVVSPWREAIPPGGREKLASPQGVPAGRGRLLGAVG